MWCGKKPFPLCCRVLCQESLTFMPISIAHASPNRGCLSKCRKWKFCCGIIFFKRSCFRNLQHAVLPNEKYPHWQLLGLKASMIHLSLLLQVHIILIACNGFPWRDSDAHESLWRSDYSTDDIFMLLSLIDQKGFKKRHSNESTHRERGYFVSDLSSRSRFHNDNGE